MSPPLLPVSPPFLPVSLPLSACSLCQTSFQMSIQLLILHLRTPPAPELPGIAAMDIFTAVSLGCELRGRIDEERISEPEQGAVSDLFGSQRVRCTAVCLNLGVVFVVCRRAEFCWQRRELFLDSPRLGFKMQFHDR